MKQAEYVSVAIYLRTDLKQKIFLNIFTVVIPPKVAKFAIFSWQKTRVFSALLQLIFSSL